MTIPYWPDTLPGPLLGLDLSPVDVKATFEADVGEPISRPRTTGAPFIAQASWIFQDAGITAFDTFYATTLAQGSVRFAMRSPHDDVVRMWRFLEGYRRTFPLKTIASVQAKLMMLPGVPWFAPYVPTDASTVPAFVADYENAIYGIDGVRVAASALPAIEGTFDVTRTVLGAPTTVEDDVITAGEIPATAPVNTTLIVGFHP